MAIAVALPAVAAIVLAPAGTVFAGSRSSQVVAVAPDGHNCLSCV